MRFFNLRLEEFLRVPRKVILPLLVVGLTVNLVLGYDVYAKSTANAPDDDGCEAVSLLMNVMQLLREKYVDRDQVKYDKLIGNAINGMVRGLDPFSAYLSPRNYKRMINETEGVGFGGIGIRIEVKKGKLIIVAPIQDSPAYKAGVKPDDIVMAIDGTPTAALSRLECVKLLKGPVGAPVTLTIYRTAEKLTKDINIVRSIISPETVKYRALENGLGYVKITLFTRPTAEDLDKALDYLKKKKINALILDLRGNPGGLLESAVEVASRFIPEEKLIVYTEGRLKSRKKRFLSLDCPKTLDMPIAILVNGNTASSAEIVSGCLQDYKRAALIGERTFGKGCVQSIVPLPNQRAVRFTTANYYAPAKRVIQGRGLKPDVEVPIARSTAIKLYSQSLAHPGEVLPEKLGATKDVQLERAIEILKGIRIFKKAEKTGE
ncbi:MAG: S41 family peptidase [Kiritimatiellaeota bacterium]|nr:S41 family peptidase [Kiritimatiellota bacterium]